MYHRLLRKPLECFFEKLEEKKKNILASFGSSRDLRKRKNKGDNKNKSSSQQPAARIKPEEPGKQPEPFSVGRSNHFLLGGIFAKGVTALADGVERRSLAPPNTCAPTLARWNETENAFRRHPPLFAGVWEGGAIKRKGRS